MRAFSVDTRMIPPAEALPVYAQRGDFAKIGTSFVETATEWGLKPDHHVLDVGCGVGRFAASFASFSGPEGRYDGVDAAPASIQTCRQYVGAHRPNFAFHVAEVHNTHYRRDADSTAATYKFPFEAETFDFVFSNSLFTHLVPADAENYLREIGRVLKPGGRTLNTMFLLNEQSRAAISDDQLPHELEGGLARVKRLDRPEAMIAFDETWLRGICAEAGLDVVEPVRYGGWSGRESTGPGFGNKDILVCERR